MMTAVTKCNNNCSCKQAQGTGKKLYAEKVGLKNKTGL